MPPKRKAHNEGPSEENTPKKLRSSNHDDAGDGFVDINTVKVYKEVLEHVCNQTDGDGRSLSAMFETLPSKSEFRVYYEFIEEPIDFKTIRKRITSKQYSSFEDLENDVLLLIKNAHTFNEPRSQISKDATALKRAFISKKNELTKSPKQPRRNTRSHRVSRTTSLDSEDHSEEGGADRTSETLESPVKPENEEESNDSKSLMKSPPIPVIPDVKKCGENLVETPQTPGTRNEGGGGSSKDDGLIDAANFDHNAFSVYYNTVVGHTDLTGRRLSQPFLRLPNKKVYPDYYEVVKRPLSFGKIRTKVKSGYYSDINILGKDLCCLFDNAMLYNKPGSVLYNDAMALKAFALEKKDEIAETTAYKELRETLPSTRERNRRSCRKNYVEMLKRGRPRLVKVEDGEETSTPTTKRRTNRQPKDGTPDIIEPKNSKKKLMQMYNCVHDYKDSEGRLLSTMFLTLPDREEYPDYYRVIPNPIDMETIHSKIQSGQYGTEEEFIQDFETMFQNARHFNEEGSEIYEDSVTLEKALKKKRRWLAHLIDGKTQNTTSKGVRQSNSPSLPLLGRRISEFGTKCQELLYYVRSYLDESGRPLSEIFERLPSRTEYPDYYLLIKKPIDLTYIASRLNKYTGLDDLEQDLLLLFNNACTYNDPDSQIYKDALTLLRTMLKKKAELVATSEESNLLPDVGALVQNLLGTLYWSVINHKDEEGRLYSDSLMEVQVTTHPNRKPLSLPIIGQLIKMGFYKRLDRLQDDVLALLEIARKEGRTDSEMYEDSCELTLHFILERDRLTKDGLRLMSQAVNTKMKKIQNEIDAERKRKQEKETEEDEKYDEENASKKIHSRLKNNGPKTIEVQPEEDQLSYVQSVAVRGTEYTVGDYVYVTPEEQNRPPHIVSIEKIWTQPDGLQGIYGNWFYRPETTFHLASRKFLEKEVFRSYQSSYILFSGVISRCLVMSVKEYPKMRPQEFKEEDIYVCESRYNGKIKTFKKLKTFPPVPNHVELIERDQPLELKRVSSIFSTSSATMEMTKEKSGSEDGNAEILLSSEGYEHLLDEHCEIDSADDERGFTHYEKYSTEKDMFKIGDGVYLKSEEGFLHIAKIDRIWVDKKGIPYARCAFFLYPEDTKHIPTQLFNENECFESNREEDIPLSDIVGKCSILNLRDYQLCRPTEIAEKDVYLCTAHYNEDEMKFRRNVKGFKRLQLPQHIRDDEYWYFEQPFNPKRRPSLWLMSNLTSSNVEESKKVIEASTEEINQEKIGYALFKKELAVSLMKDSPNMPVEDIDKKTDDEWTNMSDDRKNEYIERAKTQGLGDCMFVFECLWSSCEHQYEDLQDLKIHVMEGPHLIRSAETGLFPCQWRECERKKKQLPDFKTHSQLVRHIRELHFKCHRKKILVSEKKKLYFPKHQACEDNFKSDASDRSSSRGSVTSPLSPRVPPINGHFPLPMGIPQGIPNNTMMANGIPPSQPGMFPPFRMTGQPPQAALLMQQQIMQQQQQMMMQARGQMIGGMPPRGMPPGMNNQMMQQFHQQQHQRPPFSPQQSPFARPSIPQQPTISQSGQMAPIMHPPPPPSPQQQQPKQRQQKQNPQQQQLGPHPGMHPGLNAEQQQMLMIQVQQQQQQIMKLQEQVKQLSQQHPQHPLQQQQQQNVSTAADKTPVFVAPPSNPTKLRHSEAYLRYIEGLRDEQGKMSNWGELANVSNRPSPANQLPLAWVNGDHGMKSPTDALWELRDHMLRDSITLSKYL